MSPLWRNHLYITIEPQRIGLLKLGRGIKPKWIASFQEPIPDTGKKLLSQTISDQLSQLLAEERWQDASVHITLSNQFIRYAVVPFPAQLQNHAEREAFARHSLIQAYGTAAETWVLRIQHGKTGEPCLVSAVDITLLDGLRKACMTNQVKLVSVVPYVMPVFNKHRKVFKDKLIWLVISESGYSSFCLVNDGQFIAFNGVYHDTMLEIPLLLDRENLVCSLLEPCRVVYLCATSNNDLSALFKMTIQYEFKILDVPSPT